MTLSLREAQRRIIFSSAVSALHPSACRVLQIKRLEFTIGQRRLSWPKTRSVQPQVNGEYPRVRTTTEESSTLVIRRQFLPTRRDTPKLSPENSDDFEDSDLHMYRGFYTYVQKLRTRTHGSVESESHIFGRFLRLRL